MILVEAKKKPVTTGLILYCHTSKDIAEGTNHDRHTWDHHSIINNKTFVLEMVDKI